MAQLEIDKAAADTPPSEMDAPDEMDDILDEDDDDEEDEEDDEDQ